MNRLELINQNLVLTTENGNQYPTRLWTEKKVKNGQPWSKIWVVLSKEGISETGRTYIGADEVNQSLKTNGYYEFETKTEHREGLSHGGWRSKLTDEEKTILEEAEKTIENLKKIASERVVEKVDPNSEEGILLAIERLQKKLENKRNSNQ